MASGTRPCSVPITGDIGTGKTTLMRRLFGGRGPGNAVAMMTGMHGTFTDLLQWDPLGIRR